MTEPKEQEDGWHLVARTGEIEDDTPEQVRAGDAVIALCKVNGTFYAIDDICTHEFACLSDGDIERATRSNAPSTRRGSTFPPARCAPPRRRKTSAPTR